MLDLEPTSEALADSIRNSYDGQARTEVQNLTPQQNQQLGRVILTDQQANEWFVTNWVDHPFGD